MQRGAMPSARRPRELGGQARMGSFPMGAAAPEQTGVGLRGCMLSLAGCLQVAGCRPRLRARNAR